MRTLPLLLAVLPLLHGCEADTQASSEEDFTQKTGVASLAPEIAFGETVTGQVDKKQLDLFGMDLKEGDKIRLEAVVVEGDAKPDVTLFLGGHSKVSSKEFKATGQSLTKDYVIESGGTYVFAVRPFKAEKAGRYTLKITCTGGPCKGEPFVKPLDPDDAGVCIKVARECAFDKLPSFNGAVGAVRARSTFGECLDKTSLQSGASCKTACDSPEGRSVCDGVIDILPFYADQTAACHAEFESCMSDCYDAGGDASGLENGPEEVCLLNGFNNTCDGYARDQAVCGGSLVSDSPAQCHSLCEATFGAWNDDLDDICTMECGDLPE